MPRAVGRRKRNKTVTGGARKRTATISIPPTPLAADNQEQSTSTWLALLICVASGSGWWLATADFDIWPLGWVTSAPLFWLCARTQSLRRALLYAWLSGTVANAGGFYWVAGLLERFGNMPTPVALLGLVGMAAYQAGPIVFVIWITRSVRQTSQQRLGRPLPMALLAPIAIAGMETVWPVVFPFYLAISQAWVVPIIQIADITGPVGVSALLFMTSGAIFDFVTCKDSRRRWRSPACASAIVLCSLGYGAWRMATVDSDRAGAVKLQVGIVQPNVGFRQKGSNAQSELARLHQQSHKLQAEGAEVIIWPETSYPAQLPRTITKDLPESSPWHIRKGIDVPLIIGVATLDESAPDKPPYNSAVMFDSTGRVVGMFDKVFLLLFGEYTPLADTFDWVKNMMPAAAGHFSRGEGVKIFPFEKDGVAYRFGPMICYEDLLSDFNRELGKLHPHLLVNLTNDAWFGETSEPWEHMALSVYRSIELRVDLVRAVNTGVSSLIDANGRVLKETYAVDAQVNPRGPDRLLGEVALLEGGHTVFARVGPLFGYLALALSLAFWLVWPRVRRRAHRAHE